MARSFRWTLTFVVGTSALTAVTLPEAAATGPVRSDKACSLITSAELESVLGFKGGNPLVGMEIPFTKDATHDHDGSLFTCQGRIGDRFVLVTFGNQPVTAEGRKRAKEKIAKSQGELRKRGYTINTEQLESVSCWTMAAPPADTSTGAMFATTCGGTKGPDFYAITVSATAASGLVPIAKLKVLADTAASRLP